MGMSKVSAEYRVRKGLGQSVTESMALLALVRALNLL